MEIEAPAYTLSFDRSMQVRVVYVRNGAYKATTYERLQGSTWSFQAQDRILATSLVVTGPFVDDSQTSELAARANSLYHRSEHALHCSPIGRYLKKNGCTLTFCYGDSTR